MKGGGRHKYDIGVSDELDLKDRDDLNQVLNQYGISIIFDKDEFKVVDFENGYKILTKFYKYDINKVVPILFKVLFILGKEQGELNFKQKLNNLIKV